jgi:hypothetical protein
VALAEIQIMLEVDSETAKKYNSAPDVLLSTLKLGLAKKVAETLNPDQIDHNAVARVSGLLTQLSGVRVVWSRPAPGVDRFGLEVKDARSLARLVHIACATNTPFGVEVDWNCKDFYTHDDPACIRYDLRVPRFAGNGPSDGLSILAGLLADEVG